jgi:hypothetical protein
MISFSVDAEALRCLRVSWTGPGANVHASGSEPCAGSIGAAGGGVTDGGAVRRATKERSRGPFLLSVR